MQKIDELKTPPIIGETYLVPCVVTYDDNKYYDEDYLWLDIDPNYNKIIKKSRKLICPIINHLHSDKENGQNEMHYHEDFRFITDTIKYSHRLRIIKTKDTIIEYIPLVCKTTEQLFITSIHLIKNSKLKHNCIYKGKCPHRGYDLSQEVAINGIITCPLHGLQFDNTTKKIINKN